MPFRVKMITLIQVDEADLARRVSAGNVMC